ncbi:hypothetical protein F5890DRAFT_1595313 [Lentinula detonsa]|uniref:Uncharacterized protein n=1 Tax=Lentinula detonsa TaxID=2804962 RepID=A0AA38USX0_9AGAR|nr:hypothetical protein F5890DRAFT_1595313 [Lentinula detonsa]
MLKESTSVESSSGIYFQDVAVIFWEKSLPILSVLHLSVSVFDLKVNLTVELLAPTTTMGIAESISAVGIAGTVTGLSYTQATAQQKEDEEEAKRAAEAAQAAVDNNPKNQRAGTNETGPSPGAFPVSGSLVGGGGGRGPGPGSKSSTAGGGRERGGPRQDGGGRNVVGRKEGRGGPRNQQSSAEKTIRANNTSQKKKKKEGGRRNQLQSPSVVDDNTPISDPQEPPTSAIPTAQARRQAGKNSRASNLSSQTVASDRSTPNSDDVAAQQGALAATPGKHAARNRRKKGNMQSGDLSSTPGHSLETTASPSSVPAHSQDLTSSRLSHPSPSSQTPTPRNQSRVRGSMRPRVRSRSNANVVASASHQPSESPQSVQKPLKSVAANDAVLRSNSPQGGVGSKRRGGRRANVERSRPLVLSPQINQPSTEGDG